MGLSGFVDIGIGLIFMYLVLSLVCTTVNELIATSLKWRAKDLEKTLTQIIDNGQLKDAFYNNGLISNTTRASRGGEPAPGVAPAANIQTGEAPAKGNETDAAGNPKDTEHPSYLDGRTFALALLDSLTVTKKGQEVLQKKEEQAGASPAEAKDAAAQPKTFPTFEDIKKIAGGLPDSNIRDVLLANLATGEQTVTDLRNNVAAWFDSAMDRLSGNYKRRLKVLSLIIGVIVAFAFNADSVSVGKALWGDEALRGQIVGAAAHYVNDPPKAVDCKNSDPQKEFDCNLNVLKQQEALLRPFPIGWPDQRLADQWKKDTTSGGWWWWFAALIGVLFLKIVGCLWTGLALSLGAPFWFDLLQKFMNIRGAGTKPDDEKTKKKNESAAQVA
jgi:hypothetical protein